jgi:hypothetical protein
VGDPLQNSHVVVQVGDAIVSGLVLKWHSNRTQALVTYEIEGRVATEWIAAARLRPDPAVANDDEQPTSR